MARVTALAALVLTAYLMATGCQSSHESGVKSNLHTQWTDVAADTEATTEAAKTVMTDEGLRNVQGTATKMDGKASGKMADGTKVNVTIKRQKENMSQVSVNVGSLGDPKMGAELAKKIKMKAEAR